MSTPPHIKPVEMPLGHAAALKPGTHAVGALLRPLRGGMSLAGLLGMIALALLMRPGQEATRPPGGPADFSLERARAHLNAVAARTHPIGTDAHAQVRRYLQDSLAAAGLQPVVHESLHLRTVRAGVFDAARVRNVMARIPGRASTGAIMLVAHYDSAIASPGAGDNGVGVAALLEAARALAQGPAPRNDIVVLFTDGEENGLRGARAFVAEHPWTREVRAVLNFEARGTGGPSLMFETANDARWLVDALAASGTPPYTNSLLPAVYELLPHDTDLTAFRAAGISGLNFAFAEGWSAYHTPLDRASSIEEESLNGHGRHALELARSLGDQQVRREPGVPAIYFNVPGALIVYSSTWALPVAIVLAVLLIVVAALGLRARLLTIAGLAAGLLLPIVAVGAVYFASRTVMRLLYGGERTFTMAHQVGFYLPGILLLAAAIAFGLYALLARRILTGNLIAGVLIWWSVLNVLSAIYLPGASYLAAWPVACGIAALAYHLRIARRDASPLQAFISVLLLAPAVYLVTQAMYLVFVAFTRESIVIAAVLATVCLALVAAVFVTAAVRNVWLSAAAVMTVVALVLPIVAIGRAAPNLDQPRPNHLFYVFDGNSETASWASAEELHDDWSARVMPAPERVKDTQLFPARYRSFARATFYRAAAPSGLVEAPTAAMSSDSMDGGVRTVVFTVRSARQAPEMWTCIDSDVPIQSAQIDGLDVTSSGRKLERDAKSTCVLYRGAAEGTFQVQVRTQGVGDFTVEMMDRDYQLPTAYVDRRLERPESTMPAPFVGDAAFARRSQAF